MTLEGAYIGRYRFIRLLGGGGMGEVYLAEDPRINQQVAIKVIRAETSPYPDDQATKDASRLFEREAIAVAKLDHPHILPLFDYGEVVINGIPLTYLVMPFRPEGSLLEWLRRRGTTKLLSPKEVAQIISQTAEALQHAHDRQIIHQDVKPSNLLIRELKEDLDHPDILLADFGIAKSTSATSSLSQVIRGTPTYMAPEQWEGHPVFATDQYALAIMAFELLTGRPPFLGGSVQMMYQHLNVPSGPLSAFNPSLSTEFDTVVSHALAKKPQNRFATVSAFANAFRQAVKGIDLPGTGPPLINGSSSRPPIESQSNQHSSAPKQSDKADTNKPNPLPVAKFPSDMTNADVMSGERVYEARTMGANAPDAKHRTALPSSTPSAGGNLPTPTARVIPRRRKRRWLLAIVLVGLAIIVISASAWLINSLNSGSLSGTTSGNASTLSPTLSPTDTTTQTGSGSPSGLQIVPSAAAIITNVHTSNGYDSNSLMPTQVTTTFSLNQEIDVTFSINFTQPGTIEAMFYADNQPQKSYTNKIQWTNGNNPNGVLIPGGTGMYSVPTQQGAVELYWCPQFDCSNEQLAAFIFFTVS